ncbi:MAG: DUF427 domain-containing protein [Pseudomonadota bacterium]
MFLRPPKPDPASPGQESVWDYPRPAVAEMTSKTLEVHFDGKCLAKTKNGVRTLETSHPPTYYFPPDDIDMTMLVQVAGQSLCEWKGQASYYDVVSKNGKRAARSAWTYRRPTAPFEILKGFIAFMPGEMDKCIVDGEIARPQEGGFYGGWITSDLAGPFKGPPGTRGW